VNGGWHERVRANPILAQAWFWTAEWQAGEREVDKAYAEGRYRTYTGEEFEAELERRMKPLELRHTESDSFWAD
jgi:hypothetical protein